MECQRAYEAKWREKNKERLQEVRRKRRAQSKEYAAGYNEKDWARYMVSRIRPKCQKRGIPFNLDRHLPELNERWEKGVCELTGLPLRRHLSGKRTWDSASLDRIVPADGYLYSNIRIVCFGMNAALGDWGETAFKKIATAYLERKI